MKLTQQQLNKITDCNEYHSSERLDSVVKSEYNEQAVKFLLDTETSCKIVSCGQSKPSWDSRKLHNTYGVTLKNKKSEFTFTFYDSIKNTEDKKTLKYDFYSVLTCLNIYTPDSFDDFCSDYGYEFKNETEYIKTKSTHIESLRKQKELNKLFTESELFLLSEIV